MTPEQKAKELVEKFNAIQVTVIGCSEDGYNPCVITNKMVGKNDSKQCALVCVEEIINGNFGEGYDHKFWQQVQEEIKKL